MSADQARPPVAPLRKVVSASPTSGHTGLGNTGIRSHWWRLTLECGHETERPIRNKPGAAKGKRGFALLYHPVPPGNEFPPPQHVRCYECASEAAGAEG